MQGEMIKDRRLAVRVSEETLFQLQLAAALANVTASEMIRRAIESELRRVLPPPDEELAGD